MKRSITSKIIYSYLMIIFITLFVVGAILSLTVRGYMERQAAAGLIKDASTIGEVFRNATGSDKNTEANIRQLLKDKLKAIRTAAGSMESEWAIINREMKILYPANPADNQRFKNDILPHLSNRLGNKLNKVKFRLDNTEYMAIILPVNEASNQKGKGWVVLYASVGPIRQFTAGLFGVLLVSLLITGLVAVIFGIFFAKSLARPIIKLKKRAEGLSRRDFDSKVEIATGDELQDLAETVEKMAVELKEYDAAQKIFLQNASHELKTPLMSIQGYAEGLKDGVFEDDNKALDIIVEESTRLKQLVEELIFLSKLETLEEFYRFERQSVNQVVLKSIEKVKGLARGNDITINAVLPDKEIESSLDGDKATQALINIIGNCIRYAKSYIDVTVHYSQRFAEIGVKDDGNGFKPGEAENIFKRFYKGEKGNTGLGLAIAKAIVEKHGGTIEAKNSTTGGAEFLIRLPLR